MNTSIEFERVVNIDLLALVADQTVSGRKAVTR